MKTERIEALAKIEDLIREEQDLQDTMKEMTEQCERIRDYCIDALEDMESSMRSIAELIKAHETLFPNIAKYSYCKVTGKMGAFFQISFRGEKEIEIEKVCAYCPSLHSTYEVGGGGKFGKTLSGYGFANTKSFEIYRNRIMEAKSLQSLTDLQKNADTTKEWITAIFEILRQYMENRVTALQKSMMAGIHAASLRYEKHDA